MPTPNRFARLSSLFAAAALSMTAFAPIAPAQEKPAAPVTKPTTKPATAPASTQPKFENEVLDYEAKDKKAMPAPGGIVFYGSSSFRKWTTLAKDFPTLPVLNRGFGGSTCPDAIRYVDRLVVPYAPKTVFIYEGNNDIGSGRSPEQLLADSQKLASLIHVKLPTAKIYFLAVKPSIKRVKLMDKQRQANALLEGWIKGSKDERLGYVDVFTPMLGADGQPRPELYVEDNLHMTPEGYKLWTGIIGPLIGAPGK